MGRLFWKFFLFCWLMQMIAVVSTGMMFHLKYGAMPPPPFSHQHRPPPLELPPPGIRDFGRPPPPHLLPFDTPPLEPLLAGLVASLVCALLMAWYFSKPIRSLRKAFEATAAGNLEFKLTPMMGKRRDELSDLGRDFDHMIGQLRTLMESQRRLLHDVSHELRSPLARLQVAIGLAHQTPEKIEETLSRIELESERMEKLVGELLTLSRLEAGMVGARELIHMDELINGLVGDAQFEAAAVGVSVVQVGNAEVLVDGNPELLRRAIENIVRNAIKHSPANTLVRLQAETKFQSLVLTICDHGNGVDERHLQTIFEPFFREQSGQVLNQGYGLGLAIAKRVIEAHGGSITAFNLVGSGLCMEIKLPIQPRTATSEFQR
ncbi:MAG: HAMP domain-containing protein [Methylophilales bacterium]|nr:HAMP domain-containing protein [Methylophilales bacterium]